MSDKSMNMFDGMIKKSDKIGDTMYRLSTAKRQKLVIPEGISVYDTDENVIYYGDGSTRGGICVKMRMSVRKIVHNAAASAGLTAATSADTNKLTWTTYGGALRTGDAITLAAGTGTLPSGLSATTYYTIKDADNPASDSFKVATSRANSLAGTAVSILSSGVAGWTSVYAQVAVQGTEDVLIVDPVGAALTVYLPYPTTGFSPQTTIKRASAGNFTVTIAGLTSAGAAATLTCDDVASNLTMASGVARGYTVFGDPTSGEYFTVAKVTS
jgi:hypothetical protein